MIVRGPLGSPLSQVVFLFDVDNTLLDNDRIVTDLKRYLTRKFGKAFGERYWAILEELRAELGYADYLGAVQRFRLESPREIRLLAVSSYLLAYPFAERLLPNALDAIHHVSRWGMSVILSDGDAVFQPHKIERAGLFEAVEGRVLIYIHKESELDDVFRRYPSEHYVLIDDKVRILTAVKREWGERVTTVFPRQGRFARSGDVATYRPADITIARIGEFTDHTLDVLLGAARGAGVE